MSFPPLARALAPRGSSIWSCLILSLAVVLPAGWNWSQQRSQQKENQNFLSTRVPREDSARGYVTSDRCESCHPKEYNSWHQSYHRTMTQWARPDTVRADFDNVTLRLEHKHFQLTQAGDEFHVELEDPDVDNPSGPLPRVSRRIGMLTGSHHMQVFWIPSIPGNMQVSLPFAYLLKDHRWVPMADTFLRDPTLPRDPRSFWNQTCLACHTTSPVPGLKPVPHAKASEATFDTWLGEMGIGCESCHGPGDKHTEANLNPIRRYGLRLGNSTDPTIVNPARLSAKKASEACGQCHSAHGYDNSQFLQTGSSYRPGQELTQSIRLIQPTQAKADPKLAEAIHDRPDLMSGSFWSDGVIRISGREYNGLLETPCFQRGELSCLSCHSMHESAPNNQLRAGMETNDACLQCHTQIRDNVVKHTHHPANSPGSLCYNCHMPYTTYGLLKAIRSHTIESPNAETAVRTGRPNACNLCHLDKSLGWTDDKLVKWYGAPSAKLPLEEQATAFAALLALRGDAGQRALIAWAMGWAPAREAAGESWLAPYLAQLLVDPYAAVRYIAGHSLQQLQGFQNFPYDFIAPPPDRDRAKLAALRAWFQNTQPKRRGHDVLISDDGRLQENEFKALLRQRNDRSMDLKE